MTAKTTESEKDSKGSFLVDQCGSHQIFIPENLSEEQKALASLASTFSMQETLAITDRIEASEPGLVSSLLKKAGEQGLLMVEIPEEYGGLGLSKVDATVLAEHMTYQGSFSVALTCHTGIGTLPLLYYGSHEQKKNFLPKLATGEMIGAYSLTESEAGSDALAIKTRAKISEDKQHYILNGEKVFCTNGGIADLITLFAKVDGKHFTAFLVEKNTEGLTIGKEEGKMGIHGSSTTAVMLNDAKVPAANVLGEIGRGHKIAFNTLNIGRFKLGAACLGSSKRMIENVAPQANSRIQFGKPIGQFELIRQKIARMACRTYFLESLIYRYAGDLDLNIGLLDKKAADYFDRVHDVIESFSVEAAIAKVYGAETLSFVADEAVQIFGGYGYIHGYSVEQEYRDCRINKIFEGTNEICRLIIPSTLIKRALAGQIPLMEKLGEILDGLKKGFSSSDHPKFGKLVDQAQSLKRLAIYVTGVAVQKFGEDLKEHQSILSGLADLIIETYAFDSAIARLLLIEKMGKMKKTEYVLSICEAHIAERMPYIIALAQQMIVNVAKGDEKECEPYFKALIRLVRPPVVDTDQLYDKIAARMLEIEKYG